MNELAKQGTQGVSDPLAGLRDYIIEDNFQRTVFKLPNGTKFLPSIEILERNYKRMKYKINPMSGTTSIVECYK